MLVIASGMQESGSAYFYNIINEIISRSDSGVDARGLKKDTRVNDLMKWHNNNIGKLTAPKLLRLWLASLRYGTFAAKTHSGPSRSARLMNRLGIVRIVYSYRDPRDVILSAIDHGKKIIQDGENHTFANMADFDLAIENVKGWLRIWEEYVKTPGVLAIKYEDMIVDPVAGVRGSSDFWACHSTLRQGNKYSGHTREIMSKARVRGCTITRRGLFVTGLK